MKTPAQKIRGAILVMAALILVVLIGIAAFALDLGRLYILRTEMQNAVDAAVLSAAAELNKESGAIDRAMTAANQEMLNHLAHFSRQSQLLENIQANTDIFTFYTWIGSIMDSSDPPSDCTPVDGKCITTSDDEATYVQIQLDPELFAGNGGDDGRYEIDLYFLPVFSLFGIETATTASTRVAALAGSHYEVCNYPPMMICDPSEGTGEVLVAGEQVKLKEYQGTEATWLPGAFGWLVPTEVAADPYDDGLVSNKLLAHRLGSIYGQECAPPIVRIKTGNIAGWPRWGINTRFGIYDHMTESEVLPSAPNVIDYPRDDNLTNPAAKCADGTEKFGLGSWVVTECHAINDATDPNFGDLDLTKQQQPSTYSQAHYNSYFHKGKPVPSNMTRNEYFGWELASLNNWPAAQPEVLNNVLSDEALCTGDNSDCRILNGKPSTSLIYVDDDNEHKRRELFVTALPCLAIADDKNKDINIDQVGGRWMKFFMTEHVTPPAATEGLTIYAEFIEEVTDIDDEHFKKVIQLYE